MADVGCGLGASTRILADAYPASSVRGFDSHAESVELARKAAAEAGLDGRCDFAVARAQDFPGTAYGLVATFDCLHDMGDPVAAARHIRSALSDDGVWLIVEPFAGDVPEDNLTPVGRVYYSASTFLCVPHAISEGADDALGNQAARRHQARGASGRVPDVPPGGGDPVQPGLRGPPLSPRPCAAP